MRRFGIARCRLGRGERRARRLREEREKNLVQTSGVHERERRTTALSIGVLIRWGNDDEVEREREREWRCGQRKKMMRERRVFRFWVFDWIGREISRKEENVV